MRWLLPDGASRLLWFGLIPHRGAEQRQWEIRNVIRISCSVQRQVLREDAIQKGCVTLVEKRGQNTMPGDVTKSKERNMHVMGWTPRAMTQMQSPWQHRRGGDVKPSFCHQLSYSQQGFLLPRFQENIKHMSSLLKTKEIPVVLVSMSMHSSASTKEWWVASRCPSLHTQTHPRCLLFLENMVAEFTISTAFSTLGGCFGFGLITKVINLSLKLKWY